MARRARCATSCVIRTLVVRSCALRASENARRDVSCMHGTNVRACTRTRAHAIYADARRSRACYEERRRSDRAIARAGTVTRAYISPKLSRPRPPRASLYFEIALQPNRTHAFAFHRRRSRGKLSSLLLGSPGSDLYRLPVRTLSGSI